MVDEADYELVPVTPLRKLEKEIEKLKGRAAGGNADMTSHVIEVLKLNQKIVDELAMRESELIAKLNETNSKISDLTETVAALTAVLSAAAEEEMMPDEFGQEMMPQQASEGKSEVAGKLDSIVEQNAALLNSLEVLGKELGKLSEK